MKIIKQPGNYSYAFNRYLEPIACVHTGEEVEIYTEDTFKGRIAKEDVLPETALKNMTELNPQTGPIYIEGAKPGDCLAVHILEIIPTRDWGVSCIQKPLGGLSPNKYTRMLNPPLEEKTWIYHRDEEGNYIRDEHLRFPYEPFLGTISTASALEVISSLTPYELGGNMDVPDVCPGNIVYLPVEVEGGYFFTGDVHAKQGQGELCGTAIEIAAKVRLRFELIKGKKICWPRIESPTELMVVGSAKPMEDAARIAYAQLIAWMGEYGWDAMEAYEALSIDGKLYCANMVDTVYSMVAKVSKKLAQR